MYAKTDSFDDELQELARIGKLLSHPARLAILKHLAEAQQCIVGDIANEFPFLSRTTVSQHLQELKNGGLIKGEIDGTKICYCIDKEVFMKYQRLLEKFFSQTITKCC